MIVLVDNYDSFSYNLYQLFGSLGQEIRVVRNDDMGPEELNGLQPSAVVLSPGPGRPADAGRCLEIVRGLRQDIPLLGVCLGHQCICEAYGARITYAKKLMHGKQSEVMLDLESPLFAGLPQRVPVARYHSLAVDGGTLPEVLAVTAKSDDGEIMAVQHITRPVYGVQFHPESILTPQGRRMAENFLACAEGAAAAWDKAQAGIEGGRER